MDNGLVFVIRRLRCGMLFICMGGEEGGNGKQQSGGETEAANGDGLGPPTPHLDPGHNQPHNLTLRAGPHRTPTSSSATSARSKREADLSGENTPLSTSNNTTVPSASTSQGSNNANAVNNANATAAARGPSASSVRAMRRQVEELARWLDERLGSLYVPEEGIGLGFGGSPGVEVR